MIAREGRGRTGLEPGDPEELIRPDDFVRGRVPLPAANRREPLRLDELRLLPAQRFFRLFALGDVDAGSDVAGQRAIPRELRDGGIEDPSILAVVTLEPILRRERLAPFESRRHHLEASRKVVRMDRVTPSVAKHGVESPTGEGRPRRVDVVAARVGIRHPDQNGGNVGDEPEGVFASRGAHLRPSPTTWLC